MIKKVVHKVLLVFLLLLVGIGSASATIEHFFNSIDGVHFAADSSFTVKDDKYGTSLWSKIQKNESALDIVSLQLNEDTSLYLSTPLNCSADVEITWTNANGVVDSLAKTLIIYYDTTRRKAFNFRSSFKFYGGYVVKARILDVKINGSISTSFKKVFMLTGDIYINRVYKFNCDSLVSAYTPSYDGTNQRLDLSWTPMLGADEYDFEYTFYDSASGTYGKPFFGCGACPLITSFDFLYAGNATRVTVQGNSYNISLVYNHGYVVTRLRPVHYDTLGHRIEGKWNSELGGSGSSAPAYLSNVGYQVSHMPALNWQYTAAFAEEGKRKEVTSYFDGTLRNRQSVTINNTQDKAIVGETMYDHQGRAVITTLPAPIDSGKITFYDNFNVVSPGVEYSRHDFDTGSCGFIPPPMDSITTGSVARGSSGYYSSSNPDKANLPTAYLPDAQGYPFTETEYTPDNTGRVSRQSIAGETHTLGSAHQTQYFYGKPAQEQLDRLFGSEVGNNSHYFENMVIDANGQISVSYVDENGKTVATALAGQPPSNLHSLPSYYPATTLYINLLDEGANQPNPTTVTSTFALPVTNAPARYYFTYRLYPGNYTDSACSAHVCTDCDYDIKLMVTDNCANDAPLAMRYDSNFTFAHALDTLCNHTNVTDTFSVLITAPGTYNISRTISIDPKAMSFYESEYMRKNTCIKSYSSFLNQAIANTDFGGCNVTCATCLSNLGTSSQFLTKYITEQRNAGETTPTHQDTLNADTLYAQAVVQCNALCQIPSQCANLYSEMLADVSLGGQYCDYTVLGNGHDTSYLDPVSILVYEYKYTSGYKNAAGQLDSVLINNVKYPPQDLPQNQFIQNWKPSWATTLLPFHPEYCYYRYCLFDTASNRYDADMSNTSTYASAWTQGFINPLGDSSYPATGAGHYYNINWKDPYFWGGRGSMRRKALMYKMKNYLTINWRHTNVTLSMWQVAELEEYCTEDTLQGINDTNCYPPPNYFSSGCTGDQNMVWQLFRGLYQSMKQGELDSLENKWVADSGGCSVYAECIGDSISPCAGNAYQHKHPRVVDTIYADRQHYTPYPINAATEKAFVLSQEKNNCDSMCKFEAHAWLAKLKSTCGLYWVPADTTTLMNRLIEVCDSGCDVYHPFGASTTAHGRADHDGDHSFEDVLVSVLGVSRSNLQCDSLDITMPPPWIDSTGVTGPMITYNKPDTCICNKLNYYYNNYYKPDSISGDKYYKNYNDWLNKNFGGNFSDSNMLALWRLCEGSGCYFLSTPMQLPTWLSCCGNDTFHIKAINVVNGLDTVSHFSVIHCCINCNDILGAIRIFQWQHGNNIDTMPQYQQWLEAYLNETFNFDLTYAQYNAFYIKCKDSVQDTMTVLPSCYSVGGSATVRVGPNLPFMLCNEPMTVPPQPVDTNPCYTYLMMDASYNAQNAYAQYIDSIQNIFSANYIKHCMNIDDSFHLLMPFDEYHYTLYYYDQAMNLVKTTPPDGVYPITSAALLDSVKQYRIGKAVNPTYPVDSMQTRYWYNTLNSPAQQVTPDGDTARFWYDRLGRLCLSQNGIQKPYLYSYTKYDALGRIIEVGQLNTVSTKVIPGTFVKNDATLQNFIRHWHHGQVTHTFYDSAEYTVLAQTNLRKRIASITFEDVDDSNFATYDNAIHYSYDIEGNVATLVNDNPHNTVVKQRYKRTDYYYDLVSGNVNELIYQHDSADQFMHIYEYDADNRITDVLTSHDSAYFEHDAGYEYYDHGPLAREILGQRQVQGVDYAYTINGWLKGVNSSILNPSYDMGYDGNVHNTPTATIGRDALGFTLEYFNGDYRAIGTSKFEAPGLPDTSLYNGNIAGATYSIKPLKPKTIGYKYTYDQLNRLNDLVAFTAIDTVNDKWNSPSSVLDFQEKVVYDENGNIFKYLRHGNTIGTGTSLAMDSLNYHYKKGKNQLTNVRDAVPAGNYPNDIDDEPSPRNYQYNTIGELAKDSAGGIDSILWTAYGKIKKIKKHNGDSLVYEYDPLGNRIEKRFYHTIGATVIHDTTLYSYDAAGHILAIYDRNKDTIRLSEWDIYGAKRLGSLDTALRVYPKVPANIGGTIDSTTVAYLENQKQYELDNHLGNVMITVSDRKWWIDTATLGYGQYYLPNIVSGQDYYPFGMVVPGREFQLIKDSSYTYGFNGKMRDDQIYGEENSYDYGMRMYDPRLGRFMSVDPVVHSSQSPYSNAYNNPIVFVDPNGESNVVYLVVGNEARAILASKNIKIDDIVNEANKIFSENMGVGTRVVLYNSDEECSFDPKNLDPNDSYIMLGDETDLANFSEDYPELPDYTLLWGWRPERANEGYQVGSQYRLKQGGIINIDYASYMAGKLFEGGKIGEQGEIRKFIGYLLVHVAAHNAVGDHKKNSILADADEISNHLLGRGLDGGIITPTPEKRTLNWYENSVGEIFNIFIKTFGPSPAVDNYIRNASNNHHARKYHHHKKDKTKKHAAKSDVYNVH